MRKNGRKARKILLCFAGILAIILLLITIVASPLAKRHIEKHDVKYTGREITLGSVFINPLTGSLRLSELIMFELNSDTVFASIKKFGVNLSILKLFKGTYEISSVRMNNPEIRVVRDDSLFNFTDLIERFAVTEDTLKEEELRFNIRNISLKDGTVHYSEKKIPVKIDITDINFSSGGVYWDVDTITGDFSLVPGSGRVSGDFTFSQDSLYYRMGLRVDDLDIGLFEQYLDEMTGKSNLTARINLDVKASGNFNRLLNGRASGRLEMNDLHFGPNSKNDFFSLDRFLVSFREIDLENNKFYFDSILIDRPAVLYQKYDTLDNFRRMFSTQLAEEVEEEADTISFLVDLQGADYYLNSFAVTDGRIEFNDYSIAEKFSMIITPFNIKADSIDKNNRRVKVSFDGKMIPAGNFQANLSMDPEDEKNFAFSYEFRNIPAPIFNPYILTFSAYQLDRGTVEMHGEWNVINTRINSLNHFLVLDPRDTKHVRRKDLDWLPLPLILSLVRERGSVIDYQIPVKGDLNDPSFSLSDIISDILRNILVKPPTTPYRLQVRNVENKVEKNLTLKWRMRRARVEEGQEKFMEEIARFLKDNPEARIVVQPIFHVEKEKENLLLFEARKKFFIESGKIKGPKLQAEDSMTVEKMSTKDKEFIRYLDNSVKNPDLLTLQEKCARFVGMDLINKKYEDLVGHRRNAFLDYFRENGTEKQVGMLEVKNQIPFNWFSYYKIDYRGDIPDELAEAFDKLYELNAEPPRREYFQLRRR